MASNAKVEDGIIREHLLALLKGGNAHIKPEKVISDFPESHVNAIITNIPYQPWHLLEHMRITQYDILEFIRNPKYRYMNWPEDYWPKKGTKATERDWQKSVKMFMGDHGELQEIVKDPKTDLYSKIPHGEGQTILREILLVADHNAYHLGELVLMKRSLGLWKK